MRLVTPTLSLCALAAAFTAGALTVDPPPPAAPPAATRRGSDPGSRP